MRKQLLLMLLMVFALGGTAGSGDLLWFYVGSFTSEGAEGISLCTFDPQTGEIALQKVFKGIDNPNFLRKSPDGKRLYAATRGSREIDPDGGSLAAYTIADNHDLVFLGKQSSRGDDPCYIDVSADGRWVATANYGGGSVALFPVNTDGSLLPASTVIKHQGSGPNTSRQNKPYAHSIRFSGQGELVWAADLGADRLFAYTLDRSAGLLIPAVQADAVLPAGSGPRHFEFTRDGKFCYVVNELNSTVTVFASDNGRLTEIQTISALPENFTGVSYCADLHLSPDESLVYASNRGDNSIVVFSRESSGKLVRQAYVSTEGNWPRNFAIVPGGKFLLVANQRSHNITVFKLEKGIPVFTGKELKTPAPVCIEFL